MTWRWKQYLTWKGRNICGESSFYHFGKTIAELCWWLMCITSRTLYDLAMYKFVVLKLLIKFLEILEVTKRDFNRMCLLLQKKKGCILIFSIWCVLGLLVLYDLFNNVLIVLNLYNSNWSLSLWQSCGSLVLRQNIDVFWNMDGNTFFFSFFFFSKFSWSCFINRINVFGSCQLHLQFQNKATLVEEEDSDFQWHYCWRHHLRKVIIDKFEVKLLREWHNGGNDFWPLK